MLASTQGFSHQSSPCYWDELFTTQQNFNRNSENQLYIEIWKGQEDDIDNDRDYGADNSSEDLDKADDKTVIAEDNDCDEDNIVRTFMMDEGDLQLYLDQADVIERFVKGASLNDFQTKIEMENEQAVALLDERSTTSRKCREYKGPLDQKRLYEELSRKVT
jgi:hypothetical protein